MIEIQIPFSSKFSNFFFCFSSLKSPLVKESPTMAQIHDRKSNFYSQKQSIRDELCAPQYLESAGDELIKRLAKKQTNTSTSLQEQLEIVQNFEKGFELNPDNRKGVTSLEDFKKHVFDEEEETSTLSTKREEIRDVNELMRITGLSRHELELGLCEKPNSTVSQLYMFAIKNKKQKETSEEPEKKLLAHPINRLKEIEEECFGGVKKRKCDTQHTDEIQESKMEEKIRKRKKHRKRKKKTQGNPTESSTKTSVSNPERLKNQIEPEEEEQPKPSFPRPSLWDVKDMKKWSESKKIGCNPQAFYTIKKGKIIKLQKEDGGDVGEET